MSWWLLDNHCHLSTRALCVQSQLWEPCPCPGGSWTATVTSHQGSVCPAPALATLAMSWWLLDSHSRLNTRVPVSRASPGSPGHVLVAPGQPVSPQHEVSMCPEPAPAALPSTQGPLAMSHHLNMRGPCVQPCTQQDEGMD
ncbi:hypothetical protein HGM15179_014609 [Zosterops borbonicus]|uniref:Uncharacterized protein n=1 Tax=Zosterops borbonicus TaxID=364589 RepID=A0A8K1G6Q6_9PASS|nr:hypothetical protein HGM15179_014609 [Zosterops borbonicus]